MPDWIEEAATEICNLDPLTPDKEIAAIIQRHYDAANKTHDDAPYVAVDPACPQCGRAGCECSDVK